MSIKEIKSETLYKEYAVEIPYQEINAIIDEKITEILPTVSIPGFRKGKAPTSIVRKKYEDNIISCLLYTSPSPRDRQKSRMPSSA